MNVYENKRDNSKIKALGSHQTLRLIESLAL